MANPNTQQKRAALHALARHSSLDATAVQREFEQLEVYPNRSVWMRWIDRFLLTTGTVLVLCGIIFLVAFNWDDLDRFTKLGLAQGAVIAVAIGIVIRKKNDFVQQILVTAVCVLTGVLFAVFGQIYQTGADSYDLFFNWTLTIIPFVILNRFVPLWFIWLLLVNTTTLLYVEQVGSHREIEWYTLLLTGINLAAIAVFECLTHFKKRPDTHGWFAKLIGTLVLLSLTTHTGWLIFSEGMDDDALSMHAALLVAVLIVGSVIYYFKRSIFFLAILMLSFGAVLISLLIEHMILDQGHYVGAIPFLIIGTVGLGLTTGMVYLLIRFNRLWTSDPSKLTEHAA